MDDFHNDPFLSIICVNWGCDSDIRLSLDSVVRQNYQDTNFEVVVVVSGVPFDKITELKSSYKQINVKWIVDQDEGLYNAMNLGVRRADGTHVFFLNSGDELIHKNSLTTLLKNAVVNRITLFSCVQVYQNDHYERPSKKDLLKGKKVSHQGFLAPITYVVFLFDEKIGPCADSQWMADYLNHTLYSSVDFAIVKFSLGGVSNSMSLNSLRKRVKNTAVRKKAKEYIKFFISLLISTRMRYRLFALVNGYNKVG